MGVTVYLLCDNNPLCIEVFIELVDMCGSSAPIIVFQRTMRLSEIAERDGEKAVFLRDHFVPKITATGT